MGNMLAWHAVNPGSIPGWGIHSDSDDHYNGGSPVAHKRTLGDVDKRSSPNKVKLIGQKHECPSMPRAVDVDVKHAK